MTELMADLDMMQYFGEQIFQAEIGSDALVKWELEARHGRLFCQLILEKDAIKV